MLAWLRTRPDGAGYGGRGTPARTRALRLPSGLPTPSVPRSQEAARTIVSIWWCCPRRLIKRPKITATEMSTWTPEQAKLFRAHIGSDRPTACWLLTLAGLRGFKTRQAEECLALGGGWPDAGLVAVNADGSPIRP